ncbi:5-formyltetrahydrofolate cyclo-ligase [Alphaproteobacteria bacterium]|nr:5-formyltetrahydrofolate cyclo-ligase [Alphaproteobacteria bacterium]
MDSEEKETLRAEAIRHRGRMLYDIEDTDHARDHFFTSINPAADQIVAAYWPKDKEFDTYPILEKLMEQGVTCALPVVQKDSKILKFAQWNESIDLQKGAFGILEPSEQNWVEPDIIIVPLLAFDRKGYRLGFGGGYYDATLQDIRARKQITAVGLAYAQQSCLFNLPAEDHDEKLDWVITPQKAHFYGE